MGVRPNDGWWALEEGNFCDDDDGGDYYKQDGSSKVDEDACTGCVGTPPISGVSGEFYEWGER